MCEYCDGTSNPQLRGASTTPNLLFCIRGSLLIMRALERDWCYPQWLLPVKFCPVCGRNLKDYAANNEDTTRDNEVASKTRMPYVPRRYPAYTIDDNGDIRCYEGVDAWTILKKPNEKRIFLKDIPKDAVIKEYFSDMDV